MSIYGIGGCPTIGESSSIRENTVVKISTKFSPRSNFPFTLLVSVAQRRPIKSFVDFWTKSIKDLKPMGKALCLFI